ncbi:Protein FAR1-RELATED SEQUENCE 5, partial [Bienertia sinuspersici]
MENTIRLDLNETPCNSNDEDGNCKSTEAEKGGGVMSENSIDDVVSLDNMDEAAVDNMVNASMENMAEASVDNMDEPAVDICFVTGKEFTIFCHDYAYRKGFTFYTRTTELMKEYKEMGVGRTAAGLKEPMYHMMKVIRLNCKYGGKKQTNGSIITGCPVYVFGRMIDDKMVIRKCQLEHNHCLSPKDSRFMVNYRSIDDPTAGKVTNNDQAGISIAKSYNSLLVESGEHENITYNQRDVRNVVHLNRRKSRLEGDAVALEKYFQQHYEYNQEFYSAIERDDDGRLMNAFWSDARSRAMHKDFGDIITFDTMFLCNRNLGKLSKWKEIEEALRNVVHDTLDPDEFDEAWGLVAYTNTKFLEVKVECDALKLVSESKTASLGGLSLYQAVEKFPKPVWKKRWNTFIVSCDKDKGDFSCSCKLFEFRERYILSRWRKDIVRPYEDIRVSYYDPKEFDRVKRVRELSQRHCYLSLLALHSDETFL